MADLTKDQTEALLKELRTCECGCGNVPSIAKQSSTRFGHVRGQPVRFCRGHRRRQATTYRRVKLDGRRVEAIHRIRAEKALGRPLPKGAIVHHADGSRDERAPLVICQDVAYHSLLHARMRVKAAGGNPNTDEVCRCCEKVKPRTAFTPDRTQCLGVCHYCKSCLAERARARRALAIAS